MARMAALKYAKGNFKRELEKTVVFVRRKAGENCHERKEFLEESAISGTSLCLCHGICGNIALLWGIGERELAVRMQNRLIKTVCCQEADIREILELQECDNYGLFGGIAGIGYSCLCEPGKVLELLCAGLPGRTG